jgi:hypothetical protein
MRREDFERRRSSKYTPEADDDGDHGLPVGALIFILSFLAIITVLWVQVYLMLLSRGGL